MIKSCFVKNYTFFKLTTFFLISSKYHLNFKFKVQIVQHNSKPDPTNTIGPMTNGYGARVHECSAFCTRNEKVELFRVRCTLITRRIVLSLMNSIKTTYVA
jgi:hypothetical protein